MQINPEAVILAVGAVVAFLQVGYVWQRRSAPGAFYFMLLMVDIGVWGLAGCLEALAIDPSTKIFWAKASYLGIAPIGSLWLCFSLYYRGRPGWFTGKRTLWLFLVPLIVVLLTFSNEAHGLIWSEITPLTEEPGSALVYSHGPAFWLHTLYVYALLVAGTVILVRTVLRSPSLYRSQVSLLLAGAGVPWIANFLYISGWNPFPGVDITPLAFTITGVMMSAAIFRYQLLDLMPVAYDALFLQMNSGALVLDAQERVVDINPSAQQFLEADRQVVGKPVFAILEPFPEMSAQLQCKDKVRFETHLEHGSNPRWVAVNTTPLLDRRGHPGGRLIVLDDISALKSAEAELRLAHAEALEANQLKTQLLANISHDLRTPLGAIIGFTDMLRSEVFGPISTEQHRIFGEIIDSANQLLIFVNNLIGQAQIETGKIVFKNRPFDVQELLEPVQAHVALQAKKKGILLEMNVDETLANPLCGDVYWLRQVLLNLVSNAVKFTENGKVTVTLSQVEDENWIIQVSDTGIGIPRSEQARIFEAFQQVDGSPTRRFQGSGLGLSIVHQLTTLMGGNVRVESEEGTGSIFTVRLPAARLEMIA